MITFIGLLIGTYVLFEAPIVFLLAFFMWVMSCIL